MSLPRPKRLYRVTEPGQQPQEGQLSSGADHVTGITSFLALCFELNVHLFSDSFHAESRPARAGEGGTFSVRQFQLQFDDLGFDRNDTYDDGRPMRGGNVSKGQRIITKHIAVDNDDLRSTNLATAKVLKPLVQELRILAHPPLRDHSGIVDLFGVAWEKQSGFLNRHWPILVLEYAPCGNLMDFLILNQSENTWSTSMRISQQIVSGLSSLHDCGVIHTDLKPENVLIAIGIEDELVAKISDFGFAIIKSDYSESKFSQTLWVQLTGFTPIWLAPEARQGRVLLEQAHMIDVYAFGLIFALIVTGGKNHLEDDGNALSLPRFQALQDNDDVAATAMDKIRHLGYSTDETNLISNILHGVLVSTPDRRHTLQLVRQDLGTDKSAELSYDERAAGEGKPDPMETDSIEGSSTESVSAFDLEVPPPFNTATPGAEGLFEPDTEPLDNVLFMPLPVQKDIYQELKSLSEYASQKSRDHSENRDWPVFRDVPDALYLLCALLFEGLGGTQNLDEAVTWLIVSAKGGSQKARLDLPRILAAYKCDLPVDVQALVPGWTEQEALSFTDRFVLDTLEDIDQTLLTKTMDEMERRWRLCTVVSNLWDTAWYDALFTACNEFCNCITQAKDKNSLNLHELGPFVMSNATVDTDEFLAFLLSPSVDTGEPRALRDYGSGLEWIHFLANFGMIETLRDLLDNLKVDLQKPDVYGRTPLYFATICGNYPMVDFLLGRGAQGSLGKDMTQNTCLHFVTSFRRHDIPRVVQRLTEAGTDVNAQNSTGSTPLHKALMRTASKTSNYSATEALLRCGADPSIQDNDGEMPHYWAVVLHQPEALELLLKATQSKISENDFLILKANLFDHLLLVPQIDTVSFSGSQFPQSLDKIVRLLIDEPTLEAYKNLPDNGGDNVFFSVSGRGKLELMRSICRCFPLIDLNEGEIEYDRPAMRHAIRHNKRSVVETLLSLGANLFYEDSLGENALHVAAMYAPELLDLILEQSMKENKIEEMIEATSVNGLSPFDTAVVNGNFEAAQILAQIGASCDQFRCLGEEGKKTTTLGHILSMPSASLEQVDFLLQFDTSYIVSEDQSTVFHALARRSSNVRDEATTDFEGDSSRLRIFDVLYSAYPNAVHGLDSKGRTPLHLASWNVLFDLVVRLGEVGVNAHSRDQEGMTALDHLRSRRASQKFASQHLLLRKKFEREMDAIEHWLLKQE